MRIQIIGIGCNACKQMEADVRAVVADWKLDATVERVDDIEQILNFRLTVLPGLAVDGKVIAMGYGGRRRTERLLREWNESNGGQLS